MRTNLLVFLAIIGSFSYIYSQSTEEILNFAISELSELKEQKFWDKESINNYLNILQNVWQSRADLQKNRKILAGFLNEYAKRIFYSNTDSDNSLQKAYFFFKLASEYGNSESLYYLSFFSYYHLDGKFIFENNLENIKEFGPNAYLKNYIDKMNSSNIVSNLYISSAQGYNISTFILGSLSHTGRGVKKSCATGALYYKQLGELFYVEDQINEFYSFELLERKRLDNEYFFNDEIETSIFYQDSPEEIEYIKMSADLGNAQYLNQLALIYYYGLRGEKKDYSKAFEYFYKASLAGDYSAKANAGIMYVRGQGVEKNVDKGLELLKQAQLKSDPRALVMLGKMNYYGYGVNKNKEKGLEYFREAASLNNTDGYYNYAMALLDAGGDSNKQIATPYLNSAAYQGHTQAMFHLGLLYLEGSHDHYNCELALALIKGALLRGPWASKFREAYHSYLKKDYRRAVILYLESVMMNYESGPINAALLINKYDVIQVKDLSILEGLKSVQSDIVYKQLVKQNILKSSEEFLRNFVTKDLQNILKLQNFNENQIKSQIDSLIQYNDDYLKKYKNRVVFELLKQGYQSDDTLSMLVLGDAYQNGEIVDQNYTEAFNAYQKIITYPVTMARFIISQAYFYQAEMYHYGLGRDSNLTKAINLYNRSLEYSKENFYLVYIKMKIAEYKNIYRKIIGKTNSLDISLEEIFIARLKKFEDDHFTKIILFSLSFLGFILMMMRKRYQNYIDLYLKDVNI